MAKKKEVTEKHKRYLCDEIQIARLSVVSRTISRMHYYIVQRWKRKIQIDFVINFSIHLNLFCLLFANRIWSVCVFWKVWNFSCSLFLYTFIIHRLLFWVASEMSTISLVHTMTLQCQCLSHNDVLLLITYDSFEYFVFVICICTMHRRKYERNGKIRTRCGYDVWMI